MKLDRKKITLYLIMLVAFIDWMGIGLVYPMFSSMLFQRDCEILPEHISDTGRGIYLGLLLATMPITLFFSAPILGTISDNKGRKKLISISLAVGILGYAIALFGVILESLIILLISRIVIGISGGSAAVVEASLADLSTKKEKVKNFGLFNMACGLGFTIGPFLGGRFSGTCIGFIEGYAMPFFLAGMAILINLVLVILFYEETHKPKGTEKINLTSGLLNIKKAFEVVGLRTVFLVIFIACVGWSFYWEFVPVTWISEYGFSTEKVGNLYAYGAAFYALSSGILIRPIVNRFSSTAVLFYALLLCGISTIAIFINSSETWLLICIPIQQYAIALFFPTSTAVVSNWVSEDIQGEIMGVLQSIQAVAFGVSPLIAGLALGIHISMPIVIGAISMLISAAVLGIFLKDQVFGKNTNI